MGAEGPIKRAAVKSLCLKPAISAGGRGTWRAGGGRTSLASTLLGVGLDTLALMDQPGARGGLVPTGP